MATKMTDMQIMAVALGNMLSEFDALDPGDLEEEDYALVAYCRRVQTAAEQGDLTPIHEEIAADDAREAAPEPAP